MGALVKSIGKRKGGQQARGSMFKSSEFGAKEKGAKRTPEERQAKRAEMISGTASGVGSFISSFGDQDTLEGLGEGFSTFEGSVVNLALFGGIATKGVAKAKKFERQARDLETAASQVSLRGTSAAINESIRANRAIGSQVVASSTALTGTSVGTALAEFEDAKSNINIIRLDAEQRAILFREQARKARKKAKFERKFGMFTEGLDLVAGFAGNIFGQ